jgi:hypothetical protein
LNRKEAIIVGALLLTSFIGSAFADTATNSSLSNDCNAKCLITSLEKPAVNGSFTAQAGFFNGGIPGYFIGGGISNYGTLTAFDTNMTLYVNGQTQGIYRLGNIPGRTTIPFRTQMPVPCGCWPSPDIGTVNATFVWK